jgi:perosamine synthetase
LSNNQSGLNDWLVPLYKIYTDEDDISIVNKTMRRGTQWAIGPEIEEFERCIANFMGRDFCVSLNSGTSALHAALLSSGIGVGDEVLTPSFTFISTVNSILFVNATPKFIDIENETFGLDPTLIESVISKKTKCIIPVHYAGLPCKISKIKEIAEKNDLIVIEDAAESLGAKENNKKTGSFGNSSILSFASNKIITTGEGGCVVTDSKEIYEKTKLIRSHGRNETLSYFENTNKPDYVNLGYNWRMSSITAALGISQFQKLDKIITLRQNIAKKYSDNLKTLSQVQIPNIPSRCTHVFQFYSICLENQQIRDDLQNYLKKQKIMSKIYFSPVHLTKLYSQYPNSPLPITENISDRILTLPLYPSMTSEEQNLVIEAIHKFFENK